MKTETNNPTAQALRAKALEIYKNKNADEPGKARTEGDYLALIHELEVHQIELELQNTELMRAKHETEEAKKRIAELYDHAPCGYLTLTRSGSIEELNLAAAQMLGLPRSSLIQRSFGHYVTHETKPSFNLFLRKVFSNEREETCEIRLQNGVNSPIDVCLTGTIKRNGDNKRCLVNVLDITAHKESELALVRAKEKAEESDRLKSAFLANMSHEIRTPMNGILGFATLLKKTKPNEEDHHKYIELIEQSGTRMLSIINDIVSISKIESGHMDTVYTETSIGSIIDSVCDLFCLECEQKGLELIRKTDPRHDATIILTDVDKVYSILTNFIKNAIKFTDVGSITVGYEKVGNHLEFCVKDTGTGISDEKQALIFERFRQGDESFTRSPDGAGLGLAISKAYAEMLDGEIWLESELGNGSSFHFTTPLNEISKPIDMKQTPLREDPSAAIQSRKLKILLVEDDKHSCAYLKKVLGDITDRILYASTGGEAIDICHANPDTDIILMDVKLPQVDGYTATSIIREFNKNVKIIAQTAFAFASDRTKALEAGCNDYIAKPYGKDTLYKIIYKHLNA